MIVYRLARLPYAQDLSGYGASLSASNRWNVKGENMLYTASNRALAFAEVYVHLRLYRIPQDMMMVSLRLPDGANLNTLTLEKDIRNYRLKETQLLGSEFINNNFQFALRVPSVVVPGEYNILINPSHPLSEQILIEDIQPFKFDSRLY